MRVEYKLEYPSLKRVDIQLNKLYNLDVYFLFKHKKSIQKSSPEWGLPFFVSFRFLIQGPSILRQPLLFFNTSYYNESH